MRIVRSLILIILVLTMIPSAEGIRISGQQREQQTGNRAKAVKIQVLSTMLADRGIGEWGFAAIVEVDGRRILFDTGARADTVLKNAAELSVDLSNVKEVILSHNHADHTGGLITLRREMMKKDPTALSVAYVGKGIFLSRPRPNGEGNKMIEWKTEYESLGGRFIEQEKPAELYRGVWLTGVVPRTHPERNWSQSGRIKVNGQDAEDNIPEDMSMVIDTDKGLILISGCGHAGIVNTLEHVRSRIRKADVYAAIGGFHLFDLSDDRLMWTSTKLREFGLRNFSGAHCTGIEAVFRIRQGVGLDRRTGVVASVGSSFDLATGIDPLNLAK